MILQNLIKIRRTTFVFEKIKRVTLKFGSMHMGSIVHTCCRLMATKCFCSGYAIVSFLMHTACAAMENLSLSADCSGWPDQCCRLTGRTFAGRRHMNHSLNLRRAASVKPTSVMRCDALYWNWLAPYGTTTQTNHQLRKIIKHRPTVYLYR